MSKEINKFCLEIPTGVLTKAAVSIVFKPDLDKRLINSILCAELTGSFSFCRPKESTLAILVTGITAGISLRRQSLSHIISARIRPLPNSPPSSARQVVDPTSRRSP